LYIHQADHPNEVFEFLSREGLREPVSDYLARRLPAKPNPSLAILLPELMAMYVHMPQLCDQLRGLLLDKAEGLSIIAIDRKGLVQTERQHLE
jgi:hypothetical protein